MSKNREINCGSCEWWRPPRSFVDYPDDDLGKCSKQIVEFSECHFNRSLLKLGLPECCRITKVSIGCYDGKNCPCWSQIQKIVAEND